MNTSTKGKRSNEAQPSMGVYFRRLGYCFVEVLQGEPLFNLAKLFESNGKPFSSARLRGTVQRWRAGKSKGYDISMDALHPHRPSKERLVRRKPSATNSRSLNLVNQANP